MRLSQREITVIKEAVGGIDPVAEIYLYGSRADDSKKGGDIDLLVISQKLTFDDKINIKAEIFKYLPEQKIDIIIAKTTSDSEFVELAFSGAIKL
ncbi:MAG: nucleotidyltransferase domain-containing protein [Oligoflexia bacterium]|nr:nucleotidyltransferase domain-containing protein [Oligoflexia bacterium]